MNLNNPKLLIIVALVLVNIRVGLTQSVTKDFNFFYTKAQKLITTNINKAEISALDANVIALDSNQKYSAKYLLGYINYSKKEYDKCSLYYEEALQYANPLQRNSLKNNLAEIYLILGDIKKAYAHINQVRREREKSKHPYLFLAYGIFGKICIEQGKQDSAQFYINKAIDLIPTKYRNRELPGFLSLTADMHKHFGNTNEAIKYYQKAAKLYSIKYKKCEMLLAIADCYVKLNNIAKAKSFLRESEHQAKQNLHNNIRLLQIKTSIHKANKNYVSLQSTYDKLETLLKRNKQQLVKEDRDFYFKVKDAMYYGMQSIAKIHNRKAGIQQNIIIALIIMVLFAIGYTFWKQQWAKPTKQVAIRKVLKVEHSTYSNENNSMPFDGFIDGLKDSPFRS